MKKHQYGDERVITKFLLLPIIIKNEIRWFKRVKIRQRYEITTDGFSYFNIWENIEFVDELN
jgi:hypothetical protein